MKKKTSSKAKKPVTTQGAKCAFVRSLPRTTPALEVQALAAKKGMEISVAYIHNIRSASGKKSREILSKKRVVKGTRAQQERLFRDLIVSLGPVRAKKLFEQVEVALVS